MRQRRDLAIEVAAEKDSAIGGDRGTIIAGQGVTPAGYVLQNRVVGVGLQCADSVGLCPLTVACLPVENRQRAMNPGVLWIGAKRLLQFDGCLRIPPLLDKLVRLCDLFGGPLGERLESIGAG